MADFHALATSLNDWYELPLGQAVVAAENKQLDMLLPRLFGLHMAQIGYTTRTAWLKSSPIHHQVTLSLSQINHQPPSLYSNFTQLPFRDDSIDVILLPHTLEFVPSIQPVLEEAWRVLTQDGHLLILGFNPWSLWGLLRIFHLYPKNSIPWSGYFHSAYKICNLVTAWGGDVILHNNFFFRPPLQTQSHLVKLNWLETAAPFLLPDGISALYLLAIKKGSIPLTPVITHWKWPETVMDKNFGTTAGRLRRG